MYFHSADQYLSICEQVLREYGAINQTIMHCIFVGPPGVGKSSLLKRLLRMKLDPTKCISTQAVEKSLRVEVIKNISTAVAQMSGFDWQITEDPLVQASGLIAQLATAQEKVFMKGNHSAVEDSNGQVTVQVGQQDSLPSSCTEEADSQVTSLPVQEAECTTSKNPASDPLQFSIAMNFFRRVVKEVGVSSVRVDNPCTLYLTDSGGQPEFQNLLPAIVAGPSVFFVVFPLNQALNSKYEVEYVRPDENKCIRKYTSSFTIKEDLMWSLASIASTEYRDIYGNEVKPKVIFVATFKDKVLHEERQRRLKELKDLIKQTDAFRQHMIVDASETEMVFTINNVSDEEAERDAKKIRAALQKISNDFKVPIPRPWLIFGILVQSLYAENSVICKEECYRLAQDCGIPSDGFEAALQFLHKQTGILHYYKELSELNQIVIRDPQHLFNRVNQLVEKTFVFEETYSSQCTEDFKRGLFTRRDYETCTQDQKNSKLNPSMLLKLLKHLNVVVPLGDGEKYFMPCAITHLDEATAVGDTQSATIHPLLITFKCGYCPKGLFGALVACIANKQVVNCTLSLDESKICRDQIGFMMGLHQLILKINPTYIYIALIPNKADSSLSADLCTLYNDVRKLIEDNIAKACKTLHYSHNANYGLSFVCQCSQWDQVHPAELRRDPLKGRFFLCTQSNKQAPVNPQCCAWLPEVGGQLQ